jgi:hypothetical protein
MGQESEENASAGRPVIDQLNGDVPYRAASDRLFSRQLHAAELCSGPGHHNSYHVEPRPPLLQFIASIDPLAAASVEYTHRPLDEQLSELGIRQVEARRLRRPGWRALCRAARR